MTRRSFSAEAALLDLVNPIQPGRRLFGRARQTQFEALQVVASRDAHIALKIRAAAAESSPHMGGQRSQVAHRRAADDNRALAGIPGRNGPRV